MPRYRVGHRYDDAFKANAVNLVLNENKTPREVADELEVRFTVICSWLVNPLLEKLQNLEMENQRLRNEQAQTPNERIRILTAENQRMADTIKTLKDAVRIFSAN